LVAVDEVQWMDHASEDALAFAVRRLPEKPVGLVLAHRTPLATEPYWSLVDSGKPRVVVGLCNP
jgi:hypothetical protein